MYYGKLESDELATIKLRRQSVSQVAGQLVIMLLGQSVCQSVN